MYEDRVHVSQADANEIPYSHMMYEAGKADSFADRIGFARLVSGNIIEEIALDFCPDCSTVDPVLEVWGSGDEIECNHCGRRVRITLEPCN